MKSSRFARIVAVFAIVLSLGISTPQKSHGILVGAPVIGGVLVTTSVAFMIFSGMHGGVNGAGWGLMFAGAFVGLVLDEETPGSMDAVSVKADMIHYDRDVARVIQEDLKVLNMEAEQKRLDIPVPVVVREFLNGDGYPSLEALESAECGLIVETQKRLSQEATQARAKELGIKKPYRIDLSTAQYLLEKWPGGFETDLTFDEIKKRQKTGNCVYAG